MKRQIGEEVWREERWLGFPPSANSPSRAMSDLARNPLTMSFVESYFSVCEVSSTRLDCISVT